MSVIADVWEWLRGGPPPANEQGIERVPWQICEEYTNACSLYGPGDSRTAEVRTKHVAVPHFPEFAEAFDNLKRAIGGSGIDWPPGETPKEEPA